MVVAVRLGHCGAELGDGFAGRVYAKARPGCDTLGHCKSQLRHCTASSSKGDARQRDATALKRLRSSRGDGLAMTSTAMQRLCPAQNATAMKARLSPAMELRCPASEGVEKQRWLGKGGAKNRYDPQRQSNGRADSNGTAAPSKGLAEMCGGIALRRVQRQSAAFNRYGGKEPISSGKASTGFAWQRPTKPAIRNGKATQCWRWLRNDRKDGRGQSRVRISNGIAFQSSARRAGRRQ